MHGTTEKRTHTMYNIPDLDTRMYFSNDYLASLASETPVPILFKVCIVLAFATP